MPTQISVVLVRASTIPSRNKPIGNAGPPIQKTILSKTGYFAKAIDLFRQAERLSPRDPRGWLIATGLGSAYFYEGHFDQALIYAEAALLQNPRFTVALRLLAASLAKLGQAGKAAAAVRELLNVEPQLTLAALRARVRFLESTSWGNAFLDALRLAGVPE